MAAAAASSSASVEQRILYRLSVATEDAIPYERLKRELDLGANGGDGAVRQLMEQNRVRLRRGTGADTKIYISLVSTMNESLSLVLDAVRASGESGIDQAQLLNKVRVPKTELGKALAALASKNLIKEHRSFTNRAKRIYTLFHIDPSAHVTGGTMYCGEELDVAFVDEWRRELTQFVSTRRMVGLDQIKRHVESLQCASGGGGGGTASSGVNSSMNTSLPAAAAPPVLTMMESGYTRSVGSGAGAGGSAGASATSASGMTFANKQLSDIDLRTLVHTLVLDGVLDMLIPDAVEEVHTPQYQLACGQSVLRHFTAQAKLRSSQPLTSRGMRGGGVVEVPARQRVRREGEVGGWNMPDGASANAVPDIEHDNIGSVMELLRQSSTWEPAPVSQPSAQEAVDGWSYMPAVGYPCLGCPQLEACSVAGRGVVNPLHCAYLKDWLS